MAPFNCCGGLGGDLVPFPSSLTHGQEDHENQQLCAGLAFSTVLSFSCSSKTVLLHKPWIQ